MQGNEFHVTCLSIQFIFIFTGEGYLTSKLMYVQGNVKETKTGLWGLKKYFVQIVEICVRDFWIFFDQQRHIVWLKWQFEHYFQQNDWRESKKAADLNNFGFECER